MVGMLASNGTIRRGTQILPSNPPIHPPASIKSSHENPVKPIDVIEGPSFDCFMGSNYGGTAN